MKPSTMLRVCVAGELVMMVIMVALSFAMVPLLPEPLRAWEAADVERVGFGDFVLVALFVPLLAGLVVASAGLLLLKRWAAWLYLGVTILAELLMPFTGPAVEHPLTQTASDLGSIFCGMVLALAFFSDALKKPETYIPPPWPAPAGGRP